MASRDEMSTSFGTARVPTSRAGPTIRPSAVEWMLQPVRHEGSALRVADVGAGTGKLTRVAVELGAEVVAIDPDAGCSPSSARRSTACRRSSGRQSGCRFPTRRVDALLFGQAWHWVDAAAASLEAGRVLRSGGVLGLIWNIRDDSVPWVARLTEVMHGSHAEQLLAEDDRGSRRRSRDGGAYVDMVPADDAEAFRAMARSRSYVITASEEERARIDAGLGELFDENRRLDGRRRAVDLPYVTTAFRGIRPTPDDAG